MESNVMPGARSSIEAQGVVRDDRIFPEVKVVAAIIVAVLLAAFAILYFMADQVGTNQSPFSWKIIPAMTPMMMGAGYISGAWFFVRLIGSSKFHHVSWGFLAITTFTWFMGLSTFLNPAPFLKTNPAGSMAD